MASGIYNDFKGDLMERNVKLTDDGDGIYVSLLSDGHTFTLTDNVIGDVDANEIINQAGSGYTAGGQLLEDKSVTTAEATKFDATDIAWSSSTFTAYHAVLYDLSNTSSLICSIDFGGAKTVSAGTFTIQWDGAGIITLT